jgi:hypothetical protein
MPTVNARPQLACDRQGIDITHTDFRALLRYGRRPNAGQACSPQAQDDIATTNLQVIVHENLL